LHELEWWLDSRGWRAKHRNRVGRVGGGGGGLADEDACTSGQRGEPPEVRRAGALKRAKTVPVMLIWFTLRRTIKLISV